MTATGAGGAVGADINGFSSSNLDLTNYALGYTGQGIEIAIIDSGLEIKHEDLIANVILNGSYNFISAINGRTIHDPTSNNTDGDHGTSVAGIAAARGGNGIGIMGVAPHASLRGFNFLKFTTLDAKLASLGFANSVANFAGMQVNTVSIFNKSYGINPTKVLAELNYTDKMSHNIVFDAIKIGTEQLRNGKGAIYVKAAGNEYSGGRVFSSDFCSEAINNNITCYNVNQEAGNVTPFQIIVGAFNANDQRASYSNTGSAIWVVGPGGEGGHNAPAIMTTDQSGCNIGYSRNSANINVNTAFNRGDNADNNSCNYYSAFNGTSSATPAVSGLAALILSANPAATWRDVKYILARTSRKIDPNLAARTMTLNGVNQIIDQPWVTNGAGFSFSNEYGFGAINVIDAVSLARTRQQTQTNISAMQTKPTVTSASFTNNNIIANANSIGLTKTLNIPTSLVVESVKLMVDISATNGSTNRIDNKIDIADYLIELISPSGTKSILMTPFNAFLSGYNMTTFNMISHAFYGEQAVGDWVLKITDVDGSTTNYIRHVGEGKLNNFAITIYGH